MNAQQMIRQAQACHIRFKQLVAEGTIPSGVDVYAYAAQITGHHVDSLKALTPSELNVLRDALEGKPSKIYDKILHCARAAGVLDLDAWVRACARSTSMAWLRGYASVQTMPVSTQWRLCRILETRARTAHPQQERPVAVVCAWCGGLVRDGRAPVSHGICEQCSDRLNRQMEGVG